MNLIEETALLLKTMEFARDSHEGQIRWGDDEDYINHPFRVYKHVTYMGGSLVARQAALLHDVVEDTHVTIEDIEILFGSAVKGVVELLTRPDDMGREVYMEKLINSGNIDALICKFADANDNRKISPKGEAYIRSRGGSPKQNIKRYSSYMVHIRVALNRLPIQHLKIDPI